MKFNEKDKKCADALRCLSIDAITNANSGHPGLPLGAAAMAYVLWKEFLNFNPHKPDWLNRDRFILSAGHGSALLYSLLHLFGFDLEMSEMKRFRKLNSRTPGHPEYSHTPGVETTTGPLGQGLANAVGIAITEKIISEKFNKPDINVIDHYTYVLCGEGDLMEGISYEAASLAGNLKLNKLICLFDCNKVTIEGSTDITFTEDIEKRFKSQNWKVIKVEDGYSMEEIAKAITKAKKNRNNPSLIIVKTHIGYKSPKQDSSKVHGEPLSREEVLKTKENLGWEYTEPFFIPDEIIFEFDKIKQKKIKTYQRWLKKWEEYKNKYPDDFKRLENFLSQIADLNIQIDFNEDMATREASYKILNLIAEKNEYLYGGSADLAPSTKTQIDKYPERNFHFGIREHAMGAICNGIAIYGFIRPFCSTFLVFSDYMKPAIRLAAMMKLPVIFIFTHDSIAVGEDGPTHQPVEHIMSLRLIPGLTVIRPADAFETYKAWEYILKNKKPVALLLTRQKVPLLNVYKDIIFDNFEKGGYFLIEEEREDVVIIATGSEVSIALKVSEILKQSGIKTSVVSMPSFEIFQRQSEEYKKRILKEKSKKFVIEAGRGAGWSDLLGEKIKVFGVEDFGKSAPEKEVYSHFGITAENIAKEILNSL